MSPNVVFNKTFVIFCVLLFGVVCSVASGAADASSVFTFLGEEHDVNIKAINVIQQTIVFFI